MTLVAPLKLTKILLENSKRIHLIGVAGSGMSGLAALLLELGHKVSGCDRVSTIDTKRLETLGLKFYLPQTAENVRTAELVIYSSAIKVGNPAFDETQRLGIPMVRRAEALAALMHSKKGLVVAGMHGKTTTAAMLTHVLRVGGVQPSHYVGAEIPILGNNARWEKSGDYFVAEGDESDGTIRLYQPQHAIVLNVEEEHLDYYRDLNAIREVFSQFMDQVSGTIVVCADDLNASKLCNGRQNVVSFGICELADYRFEKYQRLQDGCEFIVWKQGLNLGKVNLGVPGLHNASNATGVIAMASELGVSVRSIKEALQTFRGAKRRFEIILQTEDYTLVDDYGHHPSEIRATLITAKSLQPCRVVVAFQPHRYSRTSTLREQFGSAFHDADMLYVTDVYSAGEKPIDGVSGQTIASAVQAAGHRRVFYIPNRNQLLPEVARVLRPGDLFISLGAGDIHQETSRLASDLRLAVELREAMGAGDIKLYELMSKHTTLRIGGPAQFWIEPETRGGLANVLQFCTTARLPFLFVGRGSNLLVNDGGISGVVIHLGRGHFLDLSVEGDTIRAGAGLKLKQVAAAARQAQLGGFEWMEGIPGSVGGGLRMNAGAMQSELFQQVVSVQVVSPKGEFATLTPDEIDVEYRNVPTLRHCYAVEATFRGRPDNRHSIDKLLSQSAAIRKSTQPVAASAGCIFKNPKECSAGKLIEDLGLKGKTVGAARVSEIHGNFIVNDGGARASDVLQLIQEIQTIARERRGIELRLEVQTVGVDNE